MKTKWFFQFEKMIIETIIKLDKGNTMNIYVLKKKNISIDI